MLKEVLKHVTDGRRAARRYSLMGAPRIDLLDQLRFDPDVDVCGFPFHARDLGRFAAHRLIIPAKNLIARAQLSSAIAAWTCPRPACGMPVRLDTPIRCSVTDRWMGKI
jgi:hypothetical protein